MNRSVVEEIKTQTDVRGVDDDRRHLNAGYIDLHADWRPIVVRRGIESNSVSGIGYKRNSRAIDPVGPRGDLNLLRIGA